MTEIQNPKLLRIWKDEAVLVIGYWNLKFICNLVLGIWDFIDLNWGFRC